MINVKELRIGNYVLIQHPVDNEWYIEAINANTIRNLYEYPAHYLIKDRIEPVPITPELLKDLGFEYNRGFATIGKGWLKEGKMMIDERKGEFWFFSDNGNRKLEYVHQLQNLYFILGGSELELNPVSNGKDL